MGLPWAVGGGVGAGCVEPSDSRRHLARRVSLAVRLFTLYHSTLQSSVTEGAFWGDYSFLSLSPPSSSPFGLLCSRPREAAELGPRGERPSPPHRSLPPSAPGTGPGVDEGLPGPGRAGRPWGREGPLLRHRGFEASTLHIRAMDAL